jgi:hypothetical protein
MDLSGKNLNRARWALAGVLLAFGVALVLVGAAPGFYWAAFVWAAALAAAGEPDDARRAGRRGRLKRPAEPARPRR